MNENYENYKALQAKLEIDCEKCSGLCCVALYCMKTDGFPANKAAGVPCRYLNEEFRCDIHTKLIEKNMRGCLSYDCFGAGQKLTQQCGIETNWKTSAQANEIFQAFLTIFQLHQMEWYLIEALSLNKDESTKLIIEELIEKNEQMTAQKPHELIELNVDGYRQQVNDVLKKTVNDITSCASMLSKTKDFIGKDFKKADLDCADLSMALMISSNLEGCNLHGACFLGADMRDAKIKNTDLSQSVFLTQMQINSAKGNASTKLPESLIRPASWQI